MTNIGFSGLGSMGLPMATNLVAGGFDSDGRRDDTQVIRACQALNGA